MAHHHDHGHGASAGLRAGARHLGRLQAALALTVGVFVVELVTALLTRSLALLADAGHMLTDVGGLGMALAAIRLADRGSHRDHRTFGLYRLEILAALANSVLLLGVAVWVGIEALGRLDHPEEVPAGPVLAVAIVGLVANIVAFRLLQPGAEESLNIEGAYLEVLADLVGSIGVIVGALVIALTEWTWVDPVLGVAIGLFILPRTWRLGGKALRILIQAAPPGLDLATVAGDLEAIEGVVDVHDLHVWTLTSDMEVATAHVMISAGADHHRVLDEARDLL